MSDGQSSKRDAARRSYHHGDLRNALIAAGRALLTEEGIAGLDLRKVARRAGVSHTAPYRHFADKQALLAAIAEDGFALLAARLEEARRTAPPNTAARLTQLAQTYVAFAQEYPAHMREMFSGLTIERATYPSLYAASKHAFAPMLATVEQGQERGELVAGDPAELSLVLWSLIHGVAMLLIENQIPQLSADERAVQRLIESCMGHLYHGVERRI